MSNRSLRRARDPLVPTAAAAAREIRREKRRRYRRHRRRMWLFVLVLALAAGWALSNYALVLVTVRGTGMSPTVESGSVVLCLRQSLLDRLAGLLPESLCRVGRGDLAVLDYQSPEDPSASARLMKRVAGIEKDVIDIADGMLMVSGEPMYPVRDSGDWVYPITVPTRQLFVIGDHTSVAVDSRRRAFGTVPETCVSARPLAVIWPAFAAGPIH